MTVDDITYLKNAITRIESGKVSSESGSHLVGVFSKSANGFEKRLKSYVEGLLQSAGIDYEQEIRSAIKGPPFPKATLGQLIAAVKEALRLKPNVVPKLIPGKLSGFIDVSERINDAWVQIKHGEEVEGTVLVLRMKSMLSLLQQIEAGRNPPATPNKTLQPPPRLSQRSKRTETLLSIS